MKTQSPKTWHFQSSDMYRHSVSTDVVSNRFPKLFCFLFHEYAFPILLFSPRAALYHVGNIWYNVGCVCIVWLVTNGRAALVSLVELGDYPARRGWPLFLTTSSPSDLPSKKKKEGEWLTLVHRFWNDVAMLVTIQVRRTAPKKQQKERQPDLIHGGRYPAFTFLARAAGGHMAFNT